MGTKIDFRSNIRSLELLPKMTPSTLIDTFRRQASFTASYSPLYKSLFDGIASCLERDPNGNEMKWLFDISSKRAPLDTTLLLMAGIHREVLLDAPGTKLLRAYYPSVGGDKSHTCSDLPKIFKDVISSRKVELSDLLQHGTVQTNETARGIFWLFPALLTGWDCLHLVDLGASAGLNLVGDQRRFTIVGPDETDSLSFGLATDSQFTARCDQAIPRLRNSLKNIPRIVTRSGCDLNPLPLKTELDRTTLKCFVWADQLDRFKRLEEGIASYASVAVNQAIQVVPANLPHDLPQFLRSLPIEDDGVPVLIYNTYMTVYLENEGLALYDYIAAWAQETKRTILWAQAEPPKKGMPEAQGGFHWCAWTIDVWSAGEKASHWHIAWVHPHGTEIRWLQSNLEAFVEQFQHK